MTTLFDTLREDALARHAACERVLGKRGVLSSEDVHALRVATKHLRASWALLAPLLSETERSAARGAQRELADAARELSGPRDRDALAETLARLAAEAPKRRDRERLAGAHALLFGERPGKHQRASRTPALRSAFQRDAERWAACTCAISDEQLLREGCGRLYRRARRLAQRARKTGDVEAWHRCRKQTKYLGYNLSLLLGEDDPRSMRSELGALGEQLGELHDLSRLRAHVRRARTELGQPEALRGVVRLVRRHEKALAAACKAGSRASFGSSPKRFAHQLVRADP